jgi:hypothetical protein
MLFGRPLVRPDEPRAIEADPRGESEDSEPVNLSR